MAPKRTAPVTSIETDDDEPSSIAELRRQLAESQAQAAALQATIDAQDNYQAPTAFTDADYERIAAVMRRQQSQANLTDRSAYTFTLVETPCKSPKQLDPPLLSDGKDPTFTS